MTFRFAIESVDQRPADNENRQLNARGEVGGVSNPMIRQVAIGRLIASIVAVGLLLACAYSALEYRRKDREFFEWIDARPLTTSIDLSRPGKTSALLKQTCQTSHGEAFYLTVASMPPATKARMRLLEGLDGTVTILDNSGHVFESLKISSTTDEDRGDGESLMIAYFPPFAVGDYTVTFDIARGAPALKGAEQTIYAKYLLCGLERFPALIAAGFAFVFGLPAFVVLIFVANGWIRHGIWKSNVCRRETPL